MSGLARSIGAALRMGTPVTRAADTPLGLLDCGITLLMTATYTQTFVSAALLGPGWFAFVKNDTTDRETEQTLSFAAGELCDGAATVVLTSGEERLIIADGVGFRSLVLEAAPILEAGALADRPEGRTGLLFLGTDGEGLSRYNGTYWDTLLPGTVTDRADDAAGTRGGMHRAGCSQDDRAMCQPAGIT